MPSNCYINAYTLTCSAGIGLNAVSDSLQNNVSGLSNSGWPDSNVDTWLGKVDEASVASVSIAPEWESRNNRLAQLGLQQDNFTAALTEAVESYGKHRVGIILGTSTSSIGRTEEAYTQLKDGDHFAPAFAQACIHNPHSTGAYLAAALGIEGPSITISTACSSSAKAFASAQRWLDAGIVDAVLVGGVDSLCLSVIYGFNSLQLVSDQPCKPFDQDRTGISLGEAAGFALVSRTPGKLALLGYGESTDAWHMSTPHPEGLGATLSMQQALDRAGLRTRDIDYLNLHGTGTRANDNTEGLAVTKLFGEFTPALSATKGITGHTLGAAGITEAILSIESIVSGILPGTVNSVIPEAQVEDHLLLSAKAANISTAMTNSFGFGGNNCSLIFGACDQ